MAPVALHIVWRHGLLRSIRWGVEGIVLVVVPIVLVDFAFYGATVFPAYNIVFYNVLDPSTSSELYGVAPFSYYVKNLALNFNVALPFALASIPLLLLVGVCNLSFSDDELDDAIHSPRNSSSSSSPLQTSLSNTNLSSSSPSSSPPTSLSQQQQSSNNNAGISTNSSSLPSLPISSTNTSTVVSSSSPPLAVSQSNNSVQQQPITLGALMLGVLYLTPGNCFVFSFVSFKFVMKFYAAFIWLGIMVPQPHKVTHFLSYYEK